MIGIVDQVAQEYLNKVRIKDQYVSAACPFHKGGQERKPSFWIHRETGHWGCFACQCSGGNLKQLLREMGVNTRKIDAELEKAECSAVRTAKISEAKRKKRARIDFKGTHILPEALLGVFDFAPNSLLDAGFAEETLRIHDIGYDKRNNRITFPIRDIHGNLVGISGRSTSPGEIPKYKLYEGQKLADNHKVMGELGEWYPSYSVEDVRNHLWGGHFVYEKLFNTNSQLIIVEGFKARMWLAQYGWTNVVATMGTKMTATQERIIRRLGAETFLFTDNNPPGKEAAHQWGQKLASSSFPVYVVHYPAYSNEDIQPDDLSESELNEVLSSSQRVGGNYVRSKYSLENKSKYRHKKKWR